MGHTRLVEVVGRRLGLAQQPRDQPVRALAQLALLLGEGLPRARVPLVPLALGEHALPQRVRPQRLLAARAAHAHERRGGRRLARQRPQQPLEQRVQRHVRRAHHEHRPRLRALALPAAVGEQRAQRQPDQYRLAGAGPAAHQRDLAGEAR